MTKTDGLVVGSGGAKSVAEMADVHAANGSCGSWTVAAASVRGPVLVSLHLSPLDQDEGNCWVAMSSGSAVGAGQVVADIEVAVAWSL